LALEQSVGLAEATEVEREKEEDFFFFDHAQPVGGVDRSHQGLVMQLKRIKNDVCI
jgi:hypothetical protein